MTGECEKCSLLQPYGLSRAEKAVLDRMCLGESNKEIANVLQLTPATIKVHVRKILKRMKTTNRTRAALIAIGHLVQE